MHICSKFDGGKQINQNQSGSWEAWCSGAGLPMQDLSGAKTWEKITGEEANPVYAAASEKKAKEVAADRQPTRLNQADELLSTLKLMTTPRRQGGPQHDDGPGVQEVDRTVPFRAGLL